jgi:RNA polymerase sporulation-specific sigma factor
MYISESLPKPLDASEETLLFQSAINGDQIAKTKLINHNLILVVEIAKEIAKNHCFFAEDLVSVGTIGLIRAVQTKKTGELSVKDHFSQYIYKEINRFIEKRDG